MLEKIKKYSFFIGIIIFLLIISRLELSKLANILTKINFFYFTLAVSLLLPLLLTKAYRWNYLKKKQKIIYCLKDSFLMNNVGLSIGLITPGRLGELSKIFYLKNSGHSLGKSSVSVLLDRLADLFFLLIFGFFSLLFFFSFFQKTILLLTLSISFFLFLLIFFLKTNLIRIFLKKIFIFIIPSKYQKSWKLNFHDFFQGLKIYNFKNYLFIFFITTFSWLIYYLQVFFLAKSINIKNIPFLYLIMTVTIAGFITLLPVSISGLGTREATLIFLFSFFAISQELTVTFSLLILSMSLLSASIGLICWFIKPIRISSN